MFLKAVTAEAAEADRKRERQRLAGLPAGRRAAEGERRRGRPAAARRPPRRSIPPPRAPAGARRRRRRRRRRRADAYPGDDAPREQIAAWMAGQAQKRGLPPQLPLMASLVESGMKNLNFGDADSVGFFQMRVGIWNQGAYAGYPDKPELQIKWFLDQAEAVKRQRLVAGKPIDDPNQFGEWIADVERPAEQYRGRYQLKLEEANGLLASAAPPAAARPPRPPPSIRPRPRRAPPRSATRSCRRRSSRRCRRRSPPATRRARRRSPRSRRPRSTSAPTTSGAARRRRPASTAPGLMQWAYAQSGVADPARDLHADRGAERRPRSHRSTSSRATSCSSPTDGDVHHVGMSLGGDKFLHAPHTGDVVKVSSLDEPYYAQQFAGGRRFDAARRVAAAPAAPAAPRSPPRARRAAAVDPTEVAKAQAAVARDAAEVRRNDSQLFQAVQGRATSKEAEKHARA